MPTIRNVLFLCVFLTPGVCGFGKASTDEGGDPASAKPSVRQAAFSKRLEVDQGWRRTDQGWVRTADWTVSSSGTEQAHATRLHPCLIAAFVLLVSTAALLTFEPLVHRRQQKLKSDQALIQKWAQRMRRWAAANRKDCL